MRVLVINCGSSSLRAEVLDAATGERIASRKVERIAAGDHAAALEALLPELLAGAAAAIDVVAHRVVHGGERFTRPTPIDDELEAALEAVSPLAPLHNPSQLAALRAARRALPVPPHVAVFDTAFHATLPRRARAYALPSKIAERHGIRRYGFHGTSHAWTAERAAEHLGEDLRGLRVITCHLGNGCSVAAVEWGRAVETSMGMTPLEGLVMGTRSGDLDPGIATLLLREEGLDAEGLDRLLNQESGLKGLSGVGNDMRDIEERARAGDERCRLALHVFGHRLRKYIGAYAAVMGGVDVIAFTGGIGENSAGVRHRVTQRLDFLGARIDEDANRDVRVDRERPVAEISQDGSRCRILVVAADEALALARAAASVVAKRKPDAAATIPVAVSARHVHLTDGAVETLFGAGHTLTPEVELSQPGQYAAVERVTLLGPRRALEDVRVVGPSRGRCQVEISRTDEFHLGVDAPVRRSGDLDGTPGITLVGPAGRLTIRDGVICAQRHIHMTPEDAARFGVEHRDIVEVALDSDGRDLVFGDVVVRVKDSYRLEMHVDTDEGNAVELSRGKVGVLVATGRVARVTRSG